jgi:hypothetical protein
MDDFTIPFDLEASILAAGDEAGALHPVKAPKVAKEKVAKEKAPRATIAGAALAQALSGVVPTPPVFPASNAPAQRHVDAIHSLTLAGEVEKVAGYMIGGSNTYAKATRKYRDACLEYLKLAQESAPAEKPAKKASGKKKPNPTATE